MNSDREILINSLQKGVNLAKDKVRGEGEAFSWGDVADYIIADGWIRPPVKGGDILYTIVDMSHTAHKSFVSDFPIRVEPHQIYYINVMGGVSAIPFDQFGKTVFLTKEEAEAELRKRVKDNG